MVSFFIKKQRMILKSKLLITINDIEKFSQMSILEKYELTDRVKKRPRLPAVYT